MPMPPASVMERKALRPDSRSAQLAEGVLSEVGVADMNRYVLLSILLLREILLRPAIGWIAAAADPADQKPPVNW
jgi:hypothetical protein